jgi:Abnormal spindle-like microcephaly-assoc'd, ASPM-SPD-2-Hydin
VNPDGYATLVSFQYGADPTLTIFSTASAGTLPAGTTNEAAQAEISGLAPGTTYYFRVLASNAENTVPQLGSILSFTTEGETQLYPEISTEQPLLTNLPTGGTKAFGTIVLGSPVSLVFTIKNTGTANLNGLTITKSGADEAEFTVTSSPTSPIAAPTGSTTFTVQFNPATSGAKTAAIHIANNDKDENPFVINLSGSGVTAFDIAMNSATLTGNNALPLATPHNDGVNNRLK